MGRSGNKSIAWRYDSDGFFMPRLVGIESALPSSSTTLVLSRVLIPSKFDESRISTFSEKSGIKYMFFSSSIESRLTVANVSQPSRVNGRHPNTCSTSRVLTDSSSLAGKHAGEQVPVGHAQNVLIR